MLDRIRHPCTEDTRFAGSAVTSTRALERSRSTCNPRLRPGDSSLRPRELWGRPPVTIGDLQSPRPRPALSAISTPVSSAHLSRSSTYKLTFPAADSLDHSTDRRGRLCIAHDGHKNLYPPDEREITKPKPRVLRPYHANPEPNIFNNTFRRSGGLTFRGSTIGMVVFSRGRVRRRRARSDRPPDSSRQLKDTRFACSARVSFRPYDVDALEVPRQMCGA
ncbi:hypothetical protein EXIGLDRAFT_784174 [Exidia glandulosa HHB12029]|uniref:Uncharacterized protein n=1 Tax=Exidia glandulosa HHB12029 TaxID=1314781 RepID=A0A166MMK5_EXIGL|nr:hypothetical protein EXIGLDRAFT_784174 [Exidia glandulosa HHB12029]